MKLVILGAGQYGMVARDVAEATGRYESIAFLDDASDLAVGRLDDIETIDYDEAFIAIGNPTVRRQYADRVKKLATLVHPTAVVMGTVGKGSIIEPLAIISTGAVVGRCSIIMGGAVIGHNAILGDFCQIRYNAVVAERVTIPDMTQTLCGVVHEQKTQDETFLKAERNHTSKELRFFE